LNRKLDLALLPHISNKTNEGFDGMTICQLKYLFAELSNALRIIYFGKVFLLSVQRNKVFEAQTGSKDTKDREKHTLKQRRTKIKRKTILKKKYFSRTSPDVSFATASDDTLWLFLISFNFSASPFCCIFLSPLKM
jgi:hypothetical protein